MYNSSNFIKVLNPNSDERSLILEFLNKSIDNSLLNTACNEHGIKCHYCNQTVNGYNASAVDYINENYIGNNFASMLNTNALKLMENLQEKSSQNDVENIFLNVYKEEGEKIKNDFFDIVRNDFDFICIPTVETYSSYKFCSKKCVSEYQYYR